MDRFDFSPQSQSAYPVDAGADDVAPLSVVRPGKRFSERSAPPATSFARVPTKHAHQYVLGLNHRWQRYVPIFAHGETHTVFVFPLGRAELDASVDALHVSLTANSNRDAVLLEDLVSESLDRLAGEDLQYHWIRPAPVNARNSERSSAQIFMFRKTEGVMPH